MLTIRNKEIRQEIVCATKYHITNSETKIIDGKCFLKKRDY